MTNKDKYISSMDNLEFDKYIKTRVIAKVNEKIQKKYIYFFPKTIVSLAFIQIIMCFFSTAVESYFI